MSRKENGIIFDTRQNLNIGMGGKMLPPSRPMVKSKHRVLATVNKDTKIITASVPGKPDVQRLEKQKENAARLASGLSVTNRIVSDKDKRESIYKAVSGVPKLKVSEKENYVPRKNVAQKPVRAKKPITSRTLTKSDSVVSLLLPEEHKAAKPVEEVKETAKVTVVTPGVVDTDAEFADNEFILGIYAKDIYSFLRQLEQEQHVRTDYLTSSHIMTRTMRALLVDWLFEVQGSFKLLGETIQLAVALLDRYMQDHPQIAKTELQLVGVTCICLAAKYEEIYPPDIEDLIDISAKSYTRAQILKMERSIFASLDFQIGRPSPLNFLRRYGRVAKVDLVTYCFAKYFVDLAMVNYSMCHYSPSLLAAAAHYLACYLTSDTDTELEIWNPTLVFFSTYEWTSVKPVVSRLAAVVWSAPASKYQTVQKKYMEPKRLMSVSLRPELKSDKLRCLAMDK